ncbi:MAG TPA: outer membrane beta-barrel protein [Chitinophagaceae bacterium]|nr:outer membrane beta-barrel protein [Chitinophagaceae bacterium]
MKKILTGILFLISSAIFAQDSAKNGKLAVTGSVDGYYRYNFHNAKDSMHANNFTSFTNSHNSFELGMASLKADYTIGKVEAVADLGFGRRAEEFSYNDEGTLAAVKQAFISYAPSEKVKFTMGKWATHVGYEMVDAWLNRNYSMDYMFSYGPFFHTGLKMDVTVNSNFGFMIGIANPTDFTTASFAKKNLIAQIHAASANSKINAYLNYVGGKDMADATVNQFDLVFTGTISSQFSIGYNGTIKSVKPGGGSSDSWWGSALYLNYDPCSAFGLTARGEYFGDKNGVAGFGTNIYDFTLTGNIHIDNLAIMPEFRIDGAKDPIFYKEADKLSPNAKTTGSFILAAVLHF